jgi:ubiquitin-conjugating enzyme (huntingtin interacting protein 2)
MGFDVDTVVAAFNYVGVMRNNGRDYQLPMEYEGPIMNRLLGEM